MRKKNRAVGRRQRKILSVVRVELWALVGLVAVMVLMVAVADWVAPLRVMLEGSREQVAYWPGVMGVQLRTMVPL